MFLFPCRKTSYTQDVSYRLDDFKCLYSMSLELTKERRKVNGWVIYNACDMRHGYRVTRNS
jgi:hypothetical protein